MEISLSVNQARKSIQLLKEHQAGIAIISHHRFAVEGLNIHPLIEDKLLLTYAPTNRPATLANISFENLSKETFLLHEEGSTSRMVTNEWVKETGMRMSNKKELSLIETIKRSS